MNKTLLLHELLNMVNKDKWVEIYNPHDHDSLEEYQKAIED
ncbi:hypothetical protein [uncultured Catenibacterium sp.]|nr:hypothetical protein [uncultured Catenibacterium sp.]